MHLIPLLQEKGLSAQQAVWLAALVGPMQVSGRLVQFLFGRSFSSTRVGLIALMVLPVGLIALVFVAHGAWLGLLFVACYGASNGVMTISMGNAAGRAFWARALRRGEWCASNAGDRNARRRTSCCGHAVVGGRWL